MPIIALRDVRKTYETGDVHALDGVTLDVEEREIISIVGASGSGKSTLLNVIGGIDRADSGSVVVDGKEISGGGERMMLELRRRTVGIIFQFFNLMPTLTVLENVTLPAELSGSGAKAARERAHALLEAVGMGHREGHRPHELSGGEMQRTAIARALVNGPRILLADEPTGNLDSTNGEIVLDLLQRLSRREGVTLLIATHDRAIAAIADRVVEMKDGRTPAATAES
jgi:putative ABC transport system ATP-binding protein